MEAVQLLPRELLLLAQAIYTEGTASFDKISSLVLSHPATLGRQALFSPAACRRHYRALFAAEGLDVASLPSEAKRPKSHLHLKLARKYYLLRLAEARERLVLQEEQMRNLSKELTEIQAGLWDDTLTQPYILIHASHDPSAAEYAHRNSAAACSMNGRSLEPASPTEPTSPRRPAISETSARSGSAPIRPLRPSVHSAIANQGGVPMELEDTSLTTALADEAGPVPRGSPAVEGGKALDGLHSERRLESRSRPLAETEEAGVLRSLRGQDIAPAEKDTPTKSSSSLVSDAIEQNDVSRYDTNNSRSSLPRESVRRKRTVTPQNYDRGQSPALSDLSRVKRVKTEEAESSIGTPGENERVSWSGTDASATRRFRNTAPHLINQLQGSVYSTYFKDPVRPGEALNYHDIVKKPMDLKTLLQYVKSGKLSTTAEFTRDVSLIVANAVMYNGAENYVGQDAVALWKEAQMLVKVLEQAESRLV